MAAMYGGGYNTNASQFAGGGFMPRCVKGREGVRTLAALPSSTASRSLSIAHATLGSSPPSALMYAPLLPTPRSQEEPGNRAAGSAQKVRCAGQHSGRRNAASCPLGAASQR